MNQGGRSSPIGNDFDIDADIEHYETMTAEEIDTELRCAGIDAQPTVDSVVRLVDERNRWTMKALER